MLPIVFGFQVILPQAPAYVSVPRNMYTSAKEEYRANLFEYVYGSHNRWSQLITCTFAAGTCAVAIPGGVARRGTLCELEYLPV